MESRELAILERCARNLPAKKLTYHYADMTWGRVYMAWGRDMAGRYHGIWGCRDVARPLEFKLGTTATQVADVLMLDAEGFVESRLTRGLLDPVYWNGGR